MKYFLVLILTFCQLTLSSQSFTHHIELEWAQDDQGIDIFPGAVFSPERESVPKYLFRFALSDHEGFEVSLTNIRSEISDNTVSHDLPGSFEINKWTEESRDDIYGFITVSALKQNNGQLEKLRSADLFINITQKEQNSLRGGNGSSSVLMDGDIFKLAIDRTGVFKLTAGFIRDHFGMDASNLDPDRIQIFGNRGGRLPEPNAVGRTDDLGEIPTADVGLDDGVFNDGDYLIFFAHGPGMWQGNGASWQYEPNIYDNNNYVFVKVGNDERKKIDQLSSESLDNLRLSYLDHQFYGKETLNLLGRSVSHQGSGKNWLSDEISNTRSIDLSAVFDFDHLVDNALASVESHFYGRSENRTSYSIQIGPNRFEKSMGSTDYDVESTYARPGIIKESFTLPASADKVIIDYPEVGVPSEGWVDFVTLNLRKSTSGLDNGSIFRDTFSTDLGGFDLPDQPDMVIWEVSDYHDPYEIVPVRSGDRLRFSTYAPDQREFCLFDPSQINSEPIFVKEIPNQNLHALDNVDMVIISPEEFIDEAKRLQVHRAEHSDLNVELVEISQIYNEFSSGRQDPTAIRDFCKMLYDRSSRFKYLLLFGDGSYDWKHLVKTVDDQNFIPVYQTDESMAPIFAYPTDDYYALLSDDEGEGLRGALDIATGRLLCRNVEEAKVLVDKIIRYDSDPRSMGDWRNRQIYLADDEDSNRHIDDMDRIARDVLTRHPEYNQDKIYFDAYEQVATPGGARYPEAKASINSAVFKGGLVMVYLGHGGPTGLAQERVLQTTDIRSWNNYYNMPIIMTATCSFTGFDNPEITTAGEYSVLNPNGGAVAILSTVRAVYAQDNFVLTNAVHDFLYMRENGKPIPIGEVMRLAKNAVKSGSDDSNNRKFSLFGDPSMTLALPRYEVVTTSINDQPADEFQDTVGALEQITVEGFIADDDGRLLTDFNGIISPTVFDKALTLKTKANDRRSREKEFELRKNTIFKGSASVKNGRFEFTFVVPKDINFEIGSGKISYYATDNVSRDANGYYDGITIGGLGIDTLQDDKAPEVQVYMNDTNFVFGGITSPDPILLLHLSDDNGINVVGNSIGHDLTAVLDDNTQNTIILNDFYEAEVDDYREGVVRYPLSNLEEGRHSVKVTVWDIANNFSEGHTEFVVVSDPRDGLRKVLSYPNPFMTQTRFQFEHAMPMGPMTVEIEIYSVSGKMIKRITHETISEGFNVDEITWDGTDQNGSAIPKGIYLYKIKASVDVSGGTITNESQFERLVVLK
ncbi:MAG: type IX secretion system sortase PorU [Saprospiraceae bacterium]|nr:type IX secretion system sortase PorU [Saprospiraceae bacterium]